MRKGKGQTGLESHFGLVYLRKPNVKLTRYTGLSIHTIRGYPMAKLQKPGENPSRPGEYIERGPRGGAVPKPRQVTIEPGDKPLPPTQKPDRTWERISPPKKK